MANVKKSRKALKNKEIEYGSTKKKFIDKGLEETLRRSGLQRKPRVARNNKVIQVSINGKKVDETIKVRLPKNIDSEILVKPERKTKKNIAKIEQERKMIDLPSHLEFEAPEKIEVKTGIKRLVEDTQGAEYGDLPEEIDVVEEEKDKKFKKKSFFQNLKQTLGFNDDGKKEEEEEELDKKREELKKQIEKKNAGQINVPASTSQIIQQETFEVQKEVGQKEMIAQEPPKREEKKVASDVDEMGLEPIKFTDKIKRTEIPYMPQEQREEPEVLEGEVEESDEDSSIDILYSKPKKKHPQY